MNLAWGVCVSQVPLQQVGALEMPGRHPKTPLTYSAALADTTNLR